MNRGSIIVYICAGIVALICILPVLIVISSSLTAENALTLNGYTLFPSEFSTFAYEYIFRDAKQLLMSYGITATVTLLGTVLSLIVTACLAYPLSRQDFRLRNSFSFYVFFTMLFNGGLVPSYILVVQYLHLKNTIWALILPLLVQPFYVLLMRTFFRTIPPSLVEAAQVEGAGEYRIFLRIVVPLSTPVIATVGLFVSLIYWNDWFNALLYSESRRLIPLQYLLLMMMTNIEVMASNPNTGQNSYLIPSESARMAMAVIAIGPIAFVYMFFQKYFVRGLLVGAVKG